MHGPQNVKLQYECLENLLLIRGFACHTSRPLAHRLTLDTKLDTRLPAWRLTLAVSIRKYKFFRHEKKCGIGMSFAHLIILYKVY